MNDVPDHVSDVLFLFPWVNDPQPFQVSSLSIQWVGSYSICSRPFWVLPSLAAGWLISHDVADMTLVC
jgi:hypothetical protein